MNKDTGGLAFPNPGYDNGPGNYRSHPSEGMTLRDYFAAKAMQGYCANGDIDPNTPFIDIAVGAYDMADAMLEAREKQ